MAQVDVGDPAADLNRLGGLAHQLGGGQHVIVDFGAEDRVEAGGLGLLGHRTNLRRPPAGAWNDPQSQALYHRFSPCCGLLPKPSLERLSQAYNKDAVSLIFPPASVSSISVTMSRWSVSTSSRMTSHSMAAKAAGTTDRPWPSALPTPPPPLDCLVSPRLLRSAAESGGSS